MEGLQEEHFDPFFFEEDMSLECLDREAAEDSCNDGVVDYSTYQKTSASMNIHQVPFLHMLQEPSSFQLLLRLQEEQLLPRRPMQQWGLSNGKHCAAENDDSSLPPPPSSFELDSCVTHASESHSEGRNRCNNLPEPTCYGRKPGTTAASDVRAAAAQVFVGEEEKVEEREREATEKKRRKRCRASKKAEESESQRMSHIAVERNRRRLMNDHLAALRALLPQSYIQRGDQASIVGGVIDFVKELEQHLQSLEAEKQMRAVRSRPAGDAASSPRPFDGFFISPQYSTYKPSCSSESFHSTASSSVSGTVKLGEDIDAGAYGTASGAPAVAEIEATVIQTHVNLRVLAAWRAGQLLKAISALEELHLTVLHLNVTSFHDSVLYCLNLKMEEECKLGSADEIATAVHQIFAYLSSSCL